MAVPAVVPAVAGVWPQGGRSADKQAGLEVIHVKMC